MKFQYRLQLFIFPLIIFPAILAVAIFFFNARKAISDLQLNLMDIKVQGLTNSCKTELDVLKRVGVAHSDYFVQNAKNKIFEIAENTDIPGGYIFIIDLQEHVAHYPKAAGKKEQEEQLISWPNHIKEILSVKSGRVTYNEVGYSEKNERFTASFKSFDDWHWIIVATANERTTFEAIRRSSIISIASLSTTIFIAMYIFYLIARSISRPIEILKDKSISIGEGNYDVKVEINSSGELGVLSKAFNVMVKKIRDTLKERDELLITLKAKNKELLTIKSYLDNVIDSMPSILIGVDSDWNINNMNKMAEKTSGISNNAAKGKSVTSVFPEFMEYLKDKPEKKDILSKEKVCVFRYGKRTFLNISAYPLTSNGVEGAVIRIDDMTDTVRMEELMIQSEKMLSVGGLAAGMAHEINNPLAGMMQTADVMARRLGEQKDIPANMKAAEAAGTTMEAIKNFMGDRGILRMITAINDSGRRITDIVENMLSFARKSEAMASSLDMSDLLDKTLELAATDYDLKKHYDFKIIEIIKEYEDNMPLVLCEGSKIQQVLLNVLKNGSQAMHDAITPNPRFIIRTRFEKESNMIWLEIEDNGPGMDEETRKRIFEPFFTTKPVGVGTGLGLSVSYFIITANHGGEMTVESQPGSGAKFIIRLPLKGKISESVRQFP